jgi:hypothetical protein
VNDAYRHSALLLHGLNAPDRQWILAQLGAEQRAGLESQLAELKDIGIPADPTLIEAALQARQNRPPIAQDSGPGAALRQAPGAAVLRLLGPEPAWLIAAVLSLEPWPWREAIFVGLDASKRERVRQAIGQRAAPKLAQALIAELERRLPAVLSDKTSAATPAAAERSLLQRLFSLGRTP